MLITVWALFRQSLPCQQVAAAAAATSCDDFVCIFFIFDFHRRVWALIIQSLRHRRDAQSEVNTRDSAEADDFIRKSREHLPLHVSTRNGAHDNQGQAIHDGINVRGFHMKETLLKWVSKLLVKDTWCLGQVRNTENSCHK